MASDNKKYYWLKLKRDFFKRHDIRIIEEMPNGKDYILFYLKLLLESVDHEGELRFSDTIPYNEQMLSVVTNTNVDIVRSAMKLFIELGMMSICDDQTIYMNEVDKLIGSETKWAEKKRLQRAKEDNVLDVSSNCPTEIETKKEKKLEKEIHSIIHSAESEEDLSSPEHRRRYLGGIGKNVVFLSDEQMSDLLDKMSVDEFDYYVGVVADEELKGHHYKKKTHYQAILDMVAKDRKVGKKG
jgi:predicted phage replisome organizer